MANLLGITNNKYSKDIRASEYMKYMINIWQNWREKW